MFRRLLPLTYAWLVVQGALAVLAPRLAIALNARLTLIGFENPGDLEPKEWYVETARVAGVGMLAAGLAGFASSRGDSVETTVDEETVPDSE